LRRNNLLRHLIQERIEEARGRGRRL
jgi:hypothetical protein